MGDIEGREISFRLKELGEILYTYRCLWTQRAFYTDALHWEQDFPELAQFLRELPYETAVDLQNDDIALLKALSTHLPIVEKILQLISANELNTSIEHNNYPSRLINGIPGRKFSQIESFLAAVRTDDGNDIIDWCCGKGHLGRLAAYRMRNSLVTGKVTGLEWNVDLVNAGNSYALQQALPMQIVQADVLNDNLDKYLATSHQLYSLHACGDLHLKLLRDGVRHGCSALYVSPCCYHLLEARTYHPLSNLSVELFSSTLQPLLSRETIRTAVQQTTTAPRYVRLQREKMQAWRLGFDLLQRDLFQSNNYLAIPTLPTDLANGTFEAFVCYIIKHQNLNISFDIDWRIWEQRGWSRFYQVTKMDLARMAFRRALEMWMVLDRAQYLVESGYQVDIIQFCPQQLTPRNLLIRAKR